MPNTLILIDDLRPFLPTRPHNSLAAILFDNFGKLAAPISSPKFAQW